MFNFHLYNGSLPYRLFVALTVALCIWSLLSLRTDALEMAQPLGAQGSIQSDSQAAPENGAQSDAQSGEIAPGYHVHEGDASLGTGCYARPIYHEHTGSKKNGGGCYGKAVTHTHTGSAEGGGGCYTESLFHSHTGSEGGGGGCYGSAVYHSHTGSESQKGGCYQTPIYHTHEGNEAEGGACYATPLYHQHEGTEGTTTPNGCYTKAVSVNVGKVCGTFVDIGDSQWQCNSCGWVIPDWNLPYDRQHWPVKMETRYMLGCDKTEETVEGYAFSCALAEDYVEGYQLSCGKGTGTVEHYRLSCGKNETSIESYALSCGLQEGQIIEYKRNCGMSSDTIIGYELSCGMEEGALVTDTALSEQDAVIQPVKVPMEPQIDTVVEGIKYPDMEADTGVSAEGAVVDLIVGANAGGIEVDASIDEKVATKGQQEFTVSEDQTAFTLAAAEVPDGALIAIVLLAVGILFLRLYLSKTVALFYYDDANQYHSLGRIGFKRTAKGYHVEIGNALRKRATTDRYRIRTSKTMQKEAEKQHLFVRISTQVMKLRLEEYVDFTV